VQGHPAAIHPEWPDANTSGQVSFVASQPRVPVHARLPTLGERGIEAALQGPLGVTDVVDFVAKPGMSTQRSLRALCHVLGAGDALS
jgi:hypothetical protein